MVDWVKMDRKLSRMAKGYGLGIIRVPHNVLFANGRPMQGKTEFALRCASLLSRDARTIFVSSEHSPAVLLSRLVCLFGKPLLEHMDLSFLDASKMSLSKILIALEASHAKYVVWDGVGSLPMEISCFSNLTKKFTGFVITGNLDRN